MQKFLTLTFCTAACLFFSRESSSGQCNNAPCTNPFPVTNPANTCVVSDPNGLNCYTGSTTSDPAVVFPAWCGSNVNTQWFAFVADATTTTMAITSGACSQGTGVQAAIFSSGDCVNFSLVSNCLNLQNGGYGILNASGLVPGQVYYLCVGGFNGSMCNFGINGYGWGGVASGCVGGGWTYTSNNTDAIWTLIPPTAGNLSTTMGPVCHIDWLEPGPVTLCTSSPNCPDWCDHFEIHGGKFDEYVDLCEGQSVVCHGQVYTAPGIYTITEPDPLPPNCIKTTYCHVHLVPTTHTTETVYMCQNGSATCAGEEFFSPGTASVTLVGFKGCDSIINCKINVYPITPPTDLTINLCGPAEYSVCNNVYNGSGMYTEICTNWLGCDSIINLNLAILEPHAVINPPAALSCQSDTITLIGSNSSINTALGGTTSYNWFGPGIIGSSNGPTIQVNLAGIYCLVLTHARGALACKDTACVQVTASSVVPQLPQITGNSNPCQDSTYLYTAAANGSPAATTFNWTLPGNLSYTTLSPDSILVTWDTVVSGTICVTAGNACGASQPACLPIVVQTPVQQPLMSGPGEVCAGGGSYMFTLNVEQTGVNYNWTIPPGAVLTGSGDTVNINFQNSVSGPVCITPQNACGSGVPVCQNVQVNPVPAADLSSDAQICAGTSVSLNFALSGNGPFDVIWSIDNQIFMLNDISNGHVVSVSPTQTSVYKITGISDNSPTACTAVVSDSVTVTVWPAANTAAAAQICSGQSLFVGGGAQTTSGIYTDTLHTFHGCDSVIVTTLTVHVIDTIVLNTSTCDPALAGSNTQMLTQLNGCDSIVITMTALQPSDTTLIFDSSCDPNNVGVFTQNLSNVYGCDSMVVSTVTFALSDTTLIDATTCDPAAVGVFNNHLSGIDGCDSLVITTVSLLPGSSTMTSGTTCNPANVGVFTNILANQFGCDSTVITTITLAPLSTTFLTATSCDPASTGVFTNHFTTAGGCDSVIVTTVSLLPGSTTMLTGTSCNPAQVGVFTNVLTNQFGCDSTVTTTITLAPLPTTFLTASSCDPASTGVFTNHITTAGGCDSVVVTTVSLLSGSTTMLTGTSCNPAQVGVFTNALTNQFGCDSTVITTITLAPLPTTFLTATSCDPASTGVFTNHITTAGGCDSVVVTTVNLLPGSATSLATTTCDPALAGVFVYPLINQFGCDSIVTETRTLLPGSMTTINLTTCDATQAGTTSSILPNQFGCDSTIVTVTTLLPPNSCSVTVTLLGSNIPCFANTGTLTLTPTLGTAPFFYTVLQGAGIVTSGTVAALGTQQLISGLPAGNYTVNVTSPNGFSATAQAAVVQLVPPGLTSMVNSNYTGFDVSCTGATDGSALATPSGGVTPYAFTWSNGDITQQINNIAAGVYTVTVVDANGCTNVSTVALTEPAPLVLSFIVNDLDCFGQHDGAIQVAVSGGAAPYGYSLNNGPELATNLFTGLNSGVYNLTASDANDCQQTDVIVVNGATQLNVDLGDDINIGLGDQATLQATVNVPIDSLLSVVWFPPPFDSSECVSPVCLTQMVTPFISTVYTIQVQALNGCTDQDQVAVIVDRRRQIYVPNVFTPNNDGANDLFTVYAKPGAVNKILSLQVFNRWGEAMITLNDFLPNSPTIGWDGRYKGAAMNPGVFVWVAEIEFIDGQRELFKGDVTIVR